MFIANGSGFCYYYFIPMDKKKKKIRRFVKIVGATALLLFLLFSVLSHLGSGFVESFIKGKVEDMGLVSPELQVRNFSLSKLDIRNLKFGDKGKPDFIIPFLAVDYSLPALFRGYIKKIAVSGMKLQLDCSKDEWVLRGLEPLFNKRGNGSKRENLIIKNITVDSSIVQIIHSGSSVMIPFELEARFEDKIKFYNFSASIHTSGGTLFLKGNLNPGLGSGKIKVFSDNLYMENILSEALTPPDFFLKSKVQFHAEVLLNGWEVFLCDVSLSAEDFRVFHPLGMLESSLSLDFKVSGEYEPSDIILKAAVKRLSFLHYNLETDTPFTIFLNGKGIGMLEFDFSPIELAEPYSLQVANLSGIISGLPGKPVIKGKYRLEFHEDFSDCIIPGLKLPGLFPLKGEFNVTPAGEDEPIVWKIKGRGIGKPFLSYSEMKSKCDHMSLDFVASGHGGKINSTVNANIKRAVIEFDDFIFTADQIISNSRIDNISPLNFTGSGRLKIVSAKLEEANGLKVGDINIDLPWSYSLSGIDKESEDGSFDIKSIEISDLNFSKITGRIKQRKGGFEFSGDIHTPVEHLKLKLCGSSELIGDGEGMEFTMDFSMPQSTLPEGTDLGKLHPILKGMLGSGKLSGFGKISLSSSRAIEDIFKSEAFIRVNDASLVLDIEPGKMVINGLNIEVRLRDLFNLKSEKMQVLSFKNLDIGGFPVTDGRLVFEIEGPESFFIEKGEFAYFNGKILISPLRYKPDPGDLKITLYCNRLDFGRVVNTLMGKEIAFGDAELNGILHVIFSQGTPVFKDGYLYSTPGITGNLKFRESGVVSGGVLIVEEAIKDFNYNWIKIKLTSVRDLLNITVLIDGAPAGKLPLTLDPKTKDIVRNKNGKRSLVLKGLLLELRFKDIDLENLLKKTSKIHLYNKNKE